jgi:hypothetical protein
MNSAVSILINTIISSIPEESFLVLFTLIMLKRFDIKKINKRFFLKVSIPIVIPAIISNVLRYNGLDMVATTLGPLSMLVLLIAVFNVPILIKDIRHNENSMVSIMKVVLKWFKAVFPTILYMLFSLLVFQLCEVYMMLVFYVTGKNDEFFNSHVIYNFLLALPERVIEFTIITYMIFRKFNAFKFNFVKAIMESKLLLFVTLFTLLFNISVVLIGCYYFGFQMVLSGLDFMPQLSIIICVFMFPVLNIIALLTIVYNTKKREYFEKQIKKGEIKTLSSIAKKSIAKGNYKQINLIIDKLEDII